MVTNSNQDAVRLKKQAGCSGGSQAGFFDVSEADLFELYFSKQKENEGKWHTCPSVFLYSLSWYSCS